MVLCESFSFGQPTDPLTLTSESPHTPKAALTHTHGAIGNSSLLAWIIIDPAFLAKSKVRASYRETQTALG